MNDEIKAFLEEGAKKFGISYDALTLAIWNEKEEGYARQNITAELDRRGLAYTEDDLDVLVDKYFDLADSSTEERINDTIEYADVELREASDCQFEIAQGLHTYHVIHPDFGDKSLFEIDIPENIAEMSPEDIQSFIDGTLEDAAEYIEHQYGLELTDTDVSVLKGELKDVCDERTAEGPLRGNADALMNSIRGEVLHAFEESDIDYTTNQLNAVVNTVLQELANGAESYNEAVNIAFVKHGMVKIEVAEMESFGFTEGERNSLDELIAAAGEPTSSEHNRNEKDKDAR